jgi:hypothetical protein
MGRLEPSSIDFGLQGTVTHSNGPAMDALVSMRMRETNGSGAAISSTLRLLVGNGHVWATDPVSGAVETAPAASIDALITPLTPESLTSRLIVPFGAGYQRVGTEMRRGVMTVHYRASPGGTAAYASVLHFDGSATADLWFASDGGFLVAAEIASTDSHRDPSTGATIDDGFRVAFEVTHPDDAANAVELPVAPVPDPVPPGGPPVDLQLEYQVMPSNGAIATASDVEDIADTLRSRLDGTVRPVAVTIVGRDRIRVTDCNTTSPEEDRRLILAGGALTVVPLPASEYGVESKPGPKALPTVGGPIDPLKPIAPASGVSLSKPYVDEATGRRGVAFTLANQADAVFRAYAHVHPGEYVAVVLDGIVLAIVPIDGQVAKGQFSFTGEYTGAESRALAQSLYRDPVTFPLKQIWSVEFPASGA